MLKMIALASPSPSPPGILQPNRRASWSSKSKLRAQNLQPKAFSSLPSSGTFRRTIGEQSPQGRSVRHGKTLEEKMKNDKRVFLLDVNPLCYEGNRPSLQAFCYWVSHFFSQVSLADPVIAVLDGEDGHQQRKELLPSYKAHRRMPPAGKSSKGYPGRQQQFVIDALRKCNVPVVRIEGHEADDVVATLAEQILQRGHPVVIASPDKDFKQLISEDVQIVMPLTNLRRWSFYTLKHYQAQYKCDPESDLSLRCIMGDEVDGVPGIQHVVPKFGRKTAMKLVRKHGSLENLLSAAAVRTVGRPYAQEALTKHADYLRKNYEVLALRRDVEVHINEEWFIERDASNDSTAFPNFIPSLGQTQKLMSPNHLRTHMQKQGMIDGVGLFPSIACDMSNPEMQPCNVFGVSSETQTSTYWFQHPAYTTISGRKFAAP